MRNPGFSRFVSLDDQNASDLFEVVTNNDLPFDGSVILDKTGVESRLIAKSSESIKSISAHCLRQLFQVVHTNPGDIGGLVVSSCALEDITDTAKQVAKEIGITGEIRGIDKACSGFTGGTEMAVEMARELKMPIALVTTEILSCMINWQATTGKMFSKDDLRAIGKAAKIFGDRSAAVLVKPSGFKYDFEILDAYSAERDDSRNMLQLLPVTDAINCDGSVREGESSCIHMPGKSGVYLKREAPGIMVDAIQRSTQRAFERGNISEIITPDHVVAHHANGKILDAIEQELLKKGITDVRVWNLMKTLGNISACSIPTVVSLMQDEIRSGEYIAMPSIGAGSPRFKEGFLVEGCVLARKV